MTDDEITAIVGWPTEPEMLKYRKIASAAEAAERERLARICEFADGHAAQREHGAKLAALIRRA